VRDRRTERTNTHTTNEQKRIEQTHT